MLVKSAAVAGGHTQDSKAHRSSIRTASRVIKDERPGLTFERYFTRQGVDPFETVQWESRDAIISGADGRVSLDFNLSYNPPCVWTAFATCPLPTRDNRLELAVDAGELDWVH